MCDLRGFPTIMKAFSHRGRYATSCYRNKYCYPPASPVTFVLPFLVTYITDILCPTTTRYVVLILFLLWRYHISGMPHSAQKSKECFGVQTDPNGSKRIQTDPNGSKRIQAILTRPSKAVRVRVRILCRTSCINACGRSGLPGA